MKPGGVVIRFRGLIIITFFLIGMVIAAGCSSTTAPTPPHENQAILVTTPQITTTPLMLTTTPSQCQQESNNTFIRIDPVPHHYIGETITIEGTTNLAAGNMITSWIKSAEFHTCLNRGVQYPGVCTCCEGITRTLTIIHGNCGINTWSLVVNTSENGFRPDGKYFIAAGNGDVQNTTLFVTSAFPQPNLTLNPPRDDPNAYAILLSGQVNTGNGPNEKLLLTVSTDSGKKVKYTIPVVKNGTGYYWNFTMDKHLIVPYNFYTVNITSLTSPGLRSYGSFDQENGPGFYPVNPEIP